MERCKSRTSTSNKKKPPSPPFTQNSLSHHFWLISLAKVPSHQPFSFYSRCLVLVVIVTTCYNQSNGQQPCIISVCHVIYLNSFVVIFLFSRRKWVKQRTISLISIEFNQFIDGVACPNIFSFCDWNHQAFHYPSPNRTRHFVIVQDNLSFWTKLSSQHQSKLTFNPSIA